MWWHKIVIPALRRLRQVDCGFKACLDYIREPGLHNKTLCPPNKINNKIKIPK
jgi:hypothetical protein